MSQPLAVTAYVGLGANLGEPVQALQQALHALSSSAGVFALRSSGFYRSAPLGAGGPDFINAVAQLSTTLSAPDLLGVLHCVESAAGRQRPYRNAPRTLDLDLLLYGHARMDWPVLTVPHPRMWQRAFVLKPLAEIAPDLVPEAALAAVAGQSVERLH